MEQWFPVLITAVVTIIALALLIKNHKVYRKYLLPLAAHLENGAIDGHIVVRLTGRYQGYDVRVEPHPPTKNSPAYILIILFKPSSITFQVVREGTVTGFLKGMRLVKDIEVGDPTFDEKYLLRASDEMAGRMFFGNQEVRNALDRIMNSGFDSVSGDRKRIVVRKKTGTFQMENDLRPEILLPVMDALTEIARYLP